MSKRIAKPVWLAGLIGVLLIVLVACSSAPKPNPDSLKPSDPDTEIELHTAELQVNWAGTTIPPGTQSIHVVATPLGEGNPVTGTLSRPVSRLELSVPAGQVRFTATAYSDVAASGSVLATATVTVTIIAGATNPVVIRFPDLTVLNHIEVSLSPTDLRPGEAGIATAAGFDSGNNSLDFISVRWSTSDSSVATVSEEGLITAVAVGRAIITATEPITGITGNATLAVTSTTVVIESLSFGPGSGSIPAGGTLQFQAQAFDADGEPLSGIEFEYFSAAPGVLSVDNNGRARAVGVGSATVQVSVDGLVREAEIIVTPASSAPTGASWEMTTVPTYGIDFTTAASAFDIARDGTAYALTSYGDVRLRTSPDGGVTWYPVYSGDFLHQCGYNGYADSLAVAPDDSNILLVRCTDSRLIRSTDGGDTWSQVYGSIDSGPEFHGTHSELVLANNNSLVSFDAGVSWQHHPSRGTRVILESDPRSWIEYASSATGVTHDGEAVHFLRTNDGGVTWDGVAGPTNHQETCTQSYSIIGFELWASVHGDMFVYILDYCSSRPGSEKHETSLYRFDSQDAEWIRVYHEPHTHGSSGSLYNRSFYSGPTEPDTIYALTSYIRTSDVVMRSTDRGATWEPVTPTFTGSVQEASRGSVNFSQTQPGLFWSTASSRRAYTTDWGETWHDIGSGGTLIERNGWWYFYGTGYSSWVGGTSSLGSVQELALRGAPTQIGQGIIPQDQPNAVVLHGIGTQSSVTRFGRWSDDRGETWTDSPVRSLAAAQSPANSNRWYFATELGDIRVSDDGASSYRLVGRLPNLYIPQVIAPSHSDADHAYALTHGGVYRTDDGGETWQWASTNLTHVNQADLVVDPTDDNVLYVGGDGIFKSIDGGNDWTDVTSGVFNEDIRSLAISPDGSTLYAGASSGSVYRSLDAAATWEWVNTGFESYTVQDILIDPTDDNVVYVSTTGGVYKSVDKGSSWRLASSGLYSPFTTWLTISADGNTLYVGTSDHGIYRGTPTQAQGDDFLTSSLDALAVFTQNTRLWEDPFQAE